MSLLKQAADKHKLKFKKIIIYLLSWFTKMSLKKEHNQMIAIEIVYFVKNISVINVSFINVSVIFLY